MTRRINLFGGPGSGKSTTAAWLFSELKRLKYNVELVQEFVKPWTYIGRKPHVFDQIYLFGNQMQSEYQYLNNGVGTVISDSPLIMSSFYGHHHYRKDVDFVQQLVDLSLMFESRYPSLNIVLDRKNKPYHTQGRYETYEQSVQIDVDIRNFMDAHRVSYTVVEYSDRERILQLATESLQHPDV